MDSLTFIGTATTLVRLGSFTLLTDPNFLHRGQRAYLGKGLWSRRLTDPAMSPAQLPPLDAVVLSHLHGDHWDRVATRELDKSPPVFTTVKAATRLSRYGFDGRGMRTWDETLLRREREELRIVSLPGIHARGLLGPVLPPVMGSMLEHTVDGHVRIRVYLSGDTLDGTHLDAVRERFPDIDVAVVHLGGTRVLAHMVTMDDVQGVRFLRRIQPSVAVPVHYDDYRIFRSPLQRFVDRAGSSGLATDVQVVGRGDTVALRPHESPDRSS
ncbi:MAG TPA: MBL fold metallo-hydrolase [Nocardioidaceae bacterium]|nr:MBL fold metallo-hydrolase [Nocardioidaceae bacterium]